MSYTCIYDNREIIISYIFLGKSRVSWTTLIIWEAHSSNKQALKVIILVFTNILFIKFHKRKFMFLFSIFSFFICQYLKPLLKNASCQAFVEIGPFTIFFCLQCSFIGFVIIFTLEIGMVFSFIKLESSWPNFVNPRMSYSKCELNWPVSYWKENENFEWQRFTVFD